MAPPTCRRRVPAPLGQADLDPREPHVDVRTHTPAARALAATGSGDSESDVPIAIGLLSLAGTHTNAHAHMDWLARCTQQVAS